MSLFNFKGLVKKFSYEKLEKIISNGEYDFENGGVFKENISDKVIFYGAVVPLSTDDIKYSENGTYKKEDKKLYTYYSLDLQDKVIYKNKVFTVNEMKDYSDFDKDLKIYYLIKGDSYVKS